LAVAVAGNGMTPGQILTAVLTASLAGGPIFTVILQITLVVVAVALVICLVVVGVALMLLTVTAPLALCLHALPQTERIAYLWWRAIAATLAIPVLQGLILALLARVVLQPGGYGLLGIPTLATGAGNLLNLLVTCALLWLMVTLPGRMWRLGTGRPRGGGLVRGLVKTALGAAAAPDGRCGHCWALARSARRARSPPAAGHRAAGERPRAAVRGPPGARASAAAPLGVVNHADATHQGGCLPQHLPVGAEPPGQPAAKPAPAAAAPEVGAAAVWVAAGRVCGRGSARPAAAS
jgi:hypothetical protein